MRHAGDNRTGAGDGDDEQIKVNLAQVPPAIQKIIVGVTIHDGEARRQNFGMINRAFVRVVNEMTEAVRALGPLDWRTRAAMVVPETTHSPAE